MDFTTNVKRAAIRRLLMASLKLRPRAVRVSAIHDGVLFELWRCPSVDAPFDPKRFSYVFRARPVATQA